MSASKSYDVVIIGGGASGLSAALILGRSRREVLVVDAGSPRNEPAAHSHGFFTRDGAPPLELLEIARAQLVPYPSVSLLQGKVVSVSGSDGAFSAKILKKEGGEELVVGARKIILAAGVRDKLSGEIPGLRELWGGAVFHCPYCHGWEVRDQKLVLFCDLPMAFDITILIRGWSRDVTLLTNGPAKITEEARKSLEALNIPLIEKKIQALDREGSTLKAVIFDDGSKVEAQAMLHTPPQEESSGIAAALGCEKTPTGHVAATMGKTSVPGVFAIGDMVHMHQSISLAAGRGAEASFILNKELSLEDAQREIAATKASA